MMNVISESDMSIIAKTKRAYWDALNEFRTWWDFFLSVFPGKLGQSLRRRYWAKRLEFCGKDLIMAERVKIASPEKLRLGNNVGIGIGAYITAGGGVTVGNYVGIGPGAKIWSVNHIYENPHTPWLLQGSETKPVVIGNDVWVAAGSIVKPGVTIGDGAIIAAGTVLSKSIPPFAIVAGNPGRIVGWRLRPDENKESKQKGEINGTE